MAEEERRKISQRVKAALAVKRVALAREGKKLGNPRPLEALKLAVAAKRQAMSTTPEVLKLIADRHREQKNLRTIANELNRLGIDLSWKALVRVLNKPAIESGPPNGPRGSGKPASLSAFAGTRTSSAHPCAESGWSADDAA